jgi:hypothetical protein
MRSRVVLEGVGAALILLFADYLPLFHPQNHDLLHHGLPVGNLVGGLLIDLAAIAILIAAFLIALQYLPKWKQKYSAALYAGLMAWAMALAMLHALFRLLYPVLSWQHVWEACLPAVLALACAAAYLFPLTTSRAVVAIRFLTASMAFSGLWIVPHLIYVGTSRPFVPADHVADSQVKENSGSNRVIWILFDELSYDQTFEHREAGIDLPNFDKLRAESVSFSRLRPAGYYTDLIIPSLFLDRTIDNVRGSVSGQYFYRDAQQGTWSAFDPEASLFGLAAQYGWNTGVDEWYNPYCSILAPVLTRCHWTPRAVSPLEEYGASQAKSPLSNAAALPRQIGAAAMRREVTEADAHIADYLDILDHAQALIGDPSLRFVFIHLPLPRPPGIYDRQRHVLRPSGNYLDNLVLTDETLGELLNEVDTSGTADRTTVIVTSDHSWRIAIYKDKPGWTQEEQRVSGGRFDDRPVLLIHFPGQSSGKDVSAPLPEMLEHDLIAGMMRGEIHGQYDVDVFLAHFIH